MIATALFVPSAPMLLPQYVGLADPAGELRDRCVRTLRESLSGIERVVVLTDDRPSTVGRWTGESLGVRVARHLLELAGWTGPVEAGDSGGTSDQTAYLVVSDGSASRSERAPGSLDERAFAVDDAILVALAAADPVALLAVDTDLAADLLVTGLPALRATASAVAGRTDLVGEVLWSGDPWGVMYWVARWRPRGDG